MGTFGLPPFRFLTLAGDAWYSLAGKLSPFLGKNPRGDGWGRSQALSCFLFSAFSFFVPPLFPFEKSPQDGSRDLWSAAPLSLLDMSLDDASTDFRLIMVSTSFWLGAPHIDAQDVGPAQGNPTSSFTRCVPHPPCMRKNRLRKGTV